MTERETYVSERQIMEVYRKQEKWRDRGRKKWKLRESERVRDGGRESMTKGGGVV